MSLQQINIEAPPTAAAGNGTPVNVEGFGDKLVEFERTTGTYTLQWSRNGTLWNDIVTGIVADGSASTEDTTNTIPRSIKFLRVVTTADGAATFTLVAAYRGQS